MTNQWLLSLLWEMVMMVMNVTDDKEYIDNDDDENDCMRCSDKVMISKKLWNEIEIIL